MIELYFGIESEKTFSKSPLPVPATLCNRWQQKKFEVYVIFWQNDEAWMKNNMI